MADWAVVTLVMFGYFFGEMIISYFFNTKISSVGNGDWNKAAWAGFFATFLHIGLTAFSVIIGSEYDHTFGGHGYWVIPLLTSFMLALGNFVMTQIMGHLSRKKEK